MLNFQNMIFVSADVILLVSLSLSLLSGWSFLRLRVFVIPKAHSHKINLYSKRTRFAGVTTQKFSDIALNEIVGYKDQYWKQERELNPNRDRVHNILNNV